MIFRMQFELKKNSKENNKSSKRETIQSNETDQIPKTDQILNQEIKALENLVNERKKKVKRKILRMKSRKRKRLQSKE